MKAGGRDRWDYCFANQLITVKQEIFAARKFHGFHNLEIFVAF